MLFRICVRNALGSLSRQAGSLGGDVDDMFVEVVRRPAQVHGLNVNRIYAQLTTDSAGGSQ